MVLLLAVFALSLGCNNDDDDPTGDDDDTSGDDDTGDDDDATGPQGVSLERTSPSGVTITLEISADELEGIGIAAEDITLELLDLAEQPIPPDPAIDEIAGALLELGPHGTEFAVPVQLELTIPGELLAGDKPAIFLALWSEEAQQWEALPAVATLDGDTTLQVPLEHFSIYGAFATYGYPSISVVTPFSPEQPGSLLVEGQELFSETDVCTFVPLEGGDSVGPHPFNEPSSPWNNIALDEGVWELTCWVDGFDPPVRLLTRRFVVGCAEGAEGYEDLIEWYAPVLQFALAEEWLPVPLDESYFSQEGCDGDPCSVSISVLGLSEEVFGSEAQDAMARLGYRETVLASRRTFLSDNSLAWSDGASSQMGIDPVTVYASVHLGPAPINRLYLSYWMFYRHDPKASIVSGWLAGHDRDRESLTVMLEDLGAGYEPIEVVYAGHGDDHGMRFLGQSTTSWELGALPVPWEQVDRYGSHAVAYLAEGSHAVYPRPDVYEVNALGWYGAEEEAGGGFTYCPSNAPSCLAAEGIDVVDYPGAYDLSTLPVMGTVESSNSSWRHLLFSGYWVDGAAWENSTFPPFMERYHEVDEWVSTRETVNANSGALAVMGDGEVHAVACENGLDDDGDGWIDLADPGCGGDPSWTDEGGYDPTYECNDGIDNDGDGYIDSEDPECGADAMGDESVLAEDCMDGVDNDGDTLVDCADPDCIGDPNCGLTGFVTIPSGTFTMGSPVGEVGQGSDETEHQVTLTNDFEIGATEVPQLEFAGVMGWNPPDSYSNYGIGDAYPVYYVSWFDALAYANEMSTAAGLSACYVLSNVMCEDYTIVGTNYMSCMNGTQEGIDDADVSLNGVATPYDCEGYRLPTEAEWEYSARSAGTVFDAFPNGGNLNSGDENNCSGNLQLDDGSYLDDQAWYCGNDSGTSEPVGGKQPNPSGLYDMSGNVYEWTWDCYYPYGGTVTDPSGPGSGSYRVLRGGSWNYTPRYARVANRNNDDPGHRYNNLGLRLARSL